MQSQPHSGWRAAPSLSAKRIAQGADNDRPLADRARGPHSMRSNRALLLDNQLLVDVQQIILLPESANYQIQLNEKVTELRAARFAIRASTPVVPVSDMTPIRTTAHRRMTGAEGFRPRVASPDNTRPSSLRPRRTPRPLDALSSGCVAARTDCNTLDSACER
ncbi:MAG: hypothetical protein RL701_1467 [Pseudomonadota bacterium]